MMNARFGSPLRFALVAVLLLYLNSPVTAAEVLGYVGPGAGLTMLGALFAVVCVLLLAVLAPVLYPIRLLMAWRRRMNSTQPASPATKS